MNIAYIFSWDITKNDGVINKIKNQTDEWKKLKHITKLFCFSVNENKSILDIDNIYKIKGNYFAKFISTFKIVNDINHFKPDIIYLRYELFKPYFLFLKKYKILIEVNTDDVNELKLDKSLKGVVKYLYNFLTRNILFNICGGIVFPTYELQNSKHFKCFLKNKKSIVLPNCIKYPDNIIVFKNTLDQETVNLFFIGTPNQSWHGIDKLLKIAEKLGHKYVFHIVGEYKVTNIKNVIFYGYLKKDEYIDIVKKCHIAIGSLGLYKNKLNEACPLKVREYALYGFPIIIGYEDTAIINKNVSWILKIKNMENISDEELENIKYFINSYKTKIVSYNESKILFDCEGNEKKRISFFNDVLNVS